MKELNFTFYDAIGYFVPGAFLIWGLFELWYATFGNFGFSIFLDESIPGGAKIGMVIIAAYVAGHLLHAISNITIGKFTPESYPPGDYFLKTTDSRDLYCTKFDEDFQMERRKKLATAISDHFGGQPPGDESKLTDYIRKSYSICYTAVAQRDRFSLAQVYLALRGLYQGLSVACFLLFCASITAGLIRGWTFGSMSGFWVMALVIVGSLIGALLFNMRAVRFGNYLTKTVYCDFLSSQISREAKGQDS